ncbi:14510_t:CDS:2 [Acaulospora morrowiae]|uniref:14510_t:CDS:1 n=1 Tax=Acaulospora morrowiae TaxID=94023 RepID=A0A9N9E7F0_9GLOM|nr:14510_t:CDS:2 [Acaulospora morrowiae]
MSNLFHFRIIRFGVLHACTIQSVVWQYHGAASVHQLSESDFNGLVTILTPAALKPNRAQNDMGFSTETMKVEITNIVRNQS